ncbi:MAG: thioredoxin family protein [bacterium]|nr:thioredoxin family protein [bacterium]
MNKSLIGVSVVLVIGVLGVFAFNSQKKEVVMPDPEKAMERVVATTTEQYVFFSPEALAAAVDKRRVLFFYAEWCPTCAPADKDFQANASKLPADVVVVRVNHNDDNTDAAEKALAKEYGVTYQHTYVQIDAAGKKVATWNGGKLAELLENIK